VHFAALHPESVRRLILISPDGLAGEEGGLLALSRLGVLVDAGLALFTRPLIGWILKSSVFFDPSKITEEFVDSVVRTLSHEESRRAVARMAREVVGTDPVGEILPTLAARTLILWGVEDGVLPASWSLKFRDLLPDADLKLIQGCGHMPTVEKPHETALLVLAFLGYSGPSDIPTAEQHPDGEGRGPAYREGAKAYTFGRSSAMTRPPALKRLSVPVDWDTTTAIEPVMAVKAAAAACRAPSPEGRFTVVFSGLRNVPADMITPSPRTMKAPSMVENSLSVSPRLGSRTFFSSSR
jgi:hypothetical protein